LCEVETDDDEKEPDAEVGNPVYLFGKKICDDGTENDPGDDVNGFA
jgi:hypothetical protein